MRRAALFYIVAVLAIAVPAIAQTTPFPDVPADHWAAQAVQRMKDLGIISGYPDGTFGGDRTLTRYEQAAMLDRLWAKIPEPQPVPQPTGSLTGLVVGLPKLVISRFADGSAITVPITWGTCYAYFACREPFKPFQNGAANDELRIALFEKFIGIYVSVQTPATSGSVAWEYRTSGGVWSPIIGVQDSTNGFRQTGLVRLPCTMPSDWEKVSLDSSTPFYWIRARATGALAPVPVAASVGVPIVGAALEFRGAALWTGITDSEGRYTTPQLPAGAYVVYKRAPGWKALTYLVPITANQTVSLNIGPQGP